MDGHNAQGGGDSNVTVVYSVFLRTDQQQLESTGLFSSRFFEVLKA